MTTYTVYESVGMAESDNVTDYDLYDYSCQTEEKAMQHFHAVFLPVFYSLLFVLGVAANGLMITVLLRRRHFLRITEIYLLHLAVADLMLLFTFPFDAADAVTGWMFGKFMCKLTGLLKNINHLCGSFLLACIGFDRYLAIVHAISSIQIRQPKTVHLICILLWMVCLGFSVPNIVFLTVIRDETNVTNLFCFYYGYGIHANNWLHTNRVLNHLCFFVSLAVMAYCYIAIVGTLYKSQKNQAKQGAIRLALLITFVFCLCWLPYNITLLMNTLVELQLIQNVTCNYYTSLNSALEVTQCLGNFHCCLNPFLYAFVGVRFRNELIQLLCELGCGRVCLPLMTMRNNNQPSISEGAITTSTY
ncbi:C-X-C chemokine receptor type 5 [Boleophthalmus pectinirostris]|uniref:C-X-C chemokine receptor type 5 n=1 Tax=Boleophthalmus pectinirostris TaxID=150288 RepID=UPI000A1C6800|nr:C-X-C chemokine receptor type 5 [Boleophthalmus pectinirostris]